MEWITDPQAWIALATLTALEIVLGVDNIIFISILVGRLPPAQRDRARRIGLVLAMGMRIGLQTHHPFALRPSFKEIAELPLDEKVAHVLPKGLLGTAIGYALGLWPQLTTFLEDGHIPIDNNVTENAIRPFVVGRKGWLFSGSPRGACASATLYSLIETAKASGLEPRAYLNFLFERLPEATTPAAIQALLPQALKPEDLKL